jgi:NAD(P) transhydrogenase subunit beta
MSANQLALWYLVAAVSFILALKGLSGPHTARRGNLYGMVGMAIALLVTLALVYSHSKNVLPILGGMAIGGTIGAIVARRVQMTQMPELVAAMHSLVGLAAVTLVSINVFGGFLVTQRMLDMFKKKEPKPGAAKE